MIVLDHPSLITTFITALKKINQKLKNVSDNSLYFFDENLVLHSIDAGNGANFAFYMYTSDEMKKFVLGPKKVKDLQESGYDFNSNSVIEAEVSGYTRTKEPKYSYTMSLEGKGFSFAIDGKELFDFFKENKPESFTKVVIAGNHLIIYVISEQFGMEVKYDFYSQAVLDSIDTLNKANPIVQSAVNKMLDGDDKYFSSSDGKALCQMFNLIGSKKKVTTVDFFEDRIELLNRAIPYTVNEWHPKAPIELDLAPACNFGGGKDEDLFIDIIRINEEEDISLVVIGQDSEGFLGGYGYIAAAVERTY